MIEAFCLAVEAYCDNLGALDASFGYWFKPTPDKKCGAAQTSRTATRSPSTKHRNWYKIAIGLLR